MGWSGRNGKATFASVTVNSDGSTSVSGGSTTISEVIAWDAELLRKNTGFLHSESGGWEDVAIGGKMYHGSITVKLLNSDQMALIATSASGLVHLTLSNAAIVLTGLAAIESAPTSTQIDGGNAVSATYRWRSKLGWTLATGTLADGGGFSP